MHACMMHNRPGWAGAAQKLHSYGLRAKYEMRAQLRAYARATLARTFTTVLDRQMLDAVMEVKAVCYIRPPEVEVHSDGLPSTPSCTARFCNRGYENGKRTPRKVKQPQKTPVRCGNSSSSVILKFQLVSGTPTPSLQIRTSGSHRFGIRARRRLFSKSESCWNRMKAECNTTHDPFSEMIGQTDSATESGGEAEGMHDRCTISFCSPSAESKPKYKTTYKVKVCASCKTKKTPLWRDAEDGTPYCNACGIRFKKYRVCCPMCSYIPRKDEKFGNTCCQCGSKLFQYSKM